MFSRITLENFQGFQKAQEIELRPLTLIFGPNASGKSSIIRSMLLMKQSLGQTTLGSANSLSGFQYEGGDISLASFANVVHKHDESSKMQIGFELDNSVSNQLTGRAIGALVKNLSLVYTVGKSGPFSQLKMRAMIGPDSLDLEMIFKLERRSLRIISFNGEEALDFLLADIGESRFRDVLRNRAEEPTSQDDDPEDKSWQQLLSQLEFSIRGNVPSFLGMERPGRSSRLAVLEELFAFTRNATMRNFRATNHIGPLRQISDRLTYEAGLVEDDDELPPRMSRTEVVSDWLLKLTGGRYKFQPVDFYAEQVRFLGSLKSQILIDTNTNTPVTFADVGVGLSQVLPILQALQRVTERSPSSTGLLLVEQPELHLHPAMQSDLADLFIESVSQRPGLQIVAETHSESILMRIQKAIRLGKLSPDQVCILYVDKDVDESGIHSNRVSTLELNEDDDFSVRMPLSFSKLRISERL